MRRLFLISMLVLVSLIGANAQTYLAGRVYYLDLQLEREFDDVNESVKIAKENAKSFEEKEMAKSMEAINKATISYVTVKFIDDKTLKYSAVYRMDEDRARVGGASLLMIKTIKRICQNWSNTIKANYTLNGRIITAQSKKMKKKEETLTFELSDDGETLTYVTKFKRTPMPRKK